MRIYRIPCQVFENLSARVYLVLGAGPPTLIDTGSGQGESTAQILAGLETVRSEFGETVRPADIGRILITHGHLDHVGGLADLLLHTNAEVAVHPLDQRPIIACDEYAVLGNRRLDSFLQQAGVEADERSKLIATSRFGRHRRRNVPVGILLGDGQELDGLRIIHTPGHSPGHVCIAAGEVLLCGDHILAHAPAAVARIADAVHRRGALPRLAGEDRTHGRIRAGAWRPRAGNARRVRPHCHDPRQPATAAGARAGHRAAPARPRRRSPRSRGGCTPTPTVSAACWR